MGGPAIPCGKTGSSGGWRPCGAAGHGDETCHARAIPWESGSSLTAGAYHTLARCLCSVVDRAEDVLA